MAGLRWVRLDVDYLTNPKVLAAGRDGRDLHLASICWVGRHETDGHIPPTALRTIAGEVGVPQRVAELVVAAGLWTPNGSGWELHHYLEIGNPSHEQREREREGWRARQQRARVSRRESRRD